MVFSDQVQVAQKEAELLKNPGYLQMQAAKEVTSAIRDSKLYEAAQHVQASSPAFVQLDNQFSLTSRILGNSLIQ